MQTNTESIFLNLLPVEIHLQIYRDVLPRGTVHFLEQKGYMFYVFCDNCVAHPTKSCDAVIRARIPLNNWGLALENISEFGWGNPYLPPDVVSSGKVALLQVCRIIHAQALPILYAGVTFQVDDLETWVRFSGHLRYEKLCLIRSMRVNWRPDMDPPQSTQDSNRGLKLPKAFWGIVATQMPGLRELAIEIEYGSRVVLRDLNAEWHLPLHELRDLQSFTLTIYDAVDRKYGPVSSETALLTDHLRQIICSERDENAPYQPVLSETGLNIRSWSSGWYSGYRTNTA
jgi:hypothetical protein